MMCSSATAFHALSKARVKSDDSVAIFGFGGLGFSALQLSQAFGCQEIYVVDINPAKLASIAAFGGVAIDATAGDPVQQIREATGGKGVDVSIELVGSAITMGQAVRCLGILGRAALVGLTAESMSVLPYTEVINKEVEIVGVSDHLAAELPLLMQLARNGKLCFPQGTLCSVGLDAAQINAALDAVENSMGEIRTVIVPGTTK
jgi:D-arabinose 1-dehydrogenase-like Zn-dependent alcohol dehydrogenase